MLGRRGCVGLVTLWFILGGCEPEVEPGGGGRPAETDEAETPSAPLPPEPGAPEPPQQPDDDEDEDDDDGASGPAVGFISTPDGGIEEIECSLYEHDCGPGEKCSPWANDGGSAWNATKCVAIAADPDKPGESCNRIGPGLSGEDTCDQSSFCWDVNPETGEGMCIPYCEGHPNQPTCSTPGEQPSSGKLFCLCLPRCNPLLNDCAVGCGCYPVEDTFQCVPDGSGDEGVFGDACEFVNTCDPGLTCVGRDNFEGCDSQNCCTRYCSLDAVDTCPGGNVCRPWYPEGMAWPGQEDLGFCGKEGA